MAEVKLQSLIELSNIYVFMLKKTNEGKEKWIYSYKTTLKYRKRK